MFTSDAEIRNAAQMVAAALGVVLEEKHNDQFGISFHAHDTARESIGVMESARLRVRSYRPRERSGSEASSLRDRPSTIPPAGPTRSLTL
jgi:hypothetical protein